MKLQKPRFFPFRESETQKQDCFVKKTATSRERSVIFLDMSARRDRGDPSPSTPLGDDDMDSSDFSSDSFQKMDAETTPKRESHRFSFIENITPVMLRHSITESINRDKRRSSLNAPLFRDPISIGNRLSSHPQEKNHPSGEDRNNARRAFDSHVQPDAVYSANQDENKSCDSDGFVNDGTLSSNEDMAQRAAYHRLQPRNVQETSASTSTINVRELASFLEKTDSFIRYLGPGKSNSSNARNEVKAIPYKARQLNENAWNDSASTAFSPYPSKPCRQSDV